MNQGTDYFHQIYYRYVSSDNFPNDESIFLHSSKFVVLFYNQPKSKLHLLLLPRSSFLSVKNCRELSPDHVEKVKLLHSAAEIIIDHLLRNSISSNDQLRASQGLDNLSAKLAGLPNVNKKDLKSSVHIKMGYLPLPAFEPLHMHILSDDFDSIWLKTRRQWNSFNTAYFLDCTSIDEWLAAGFSIGDILPGDSRELEICLMQTIRCSHCKKAQNDIRSLKAHLKIH